ncbi:MAG: potassium transport protein Kup [Candidatus Accumulibacter adjunctus]|uniref:Probable potassium transport system protein Kup n=1 Tax=Candidatus Accumulibacter adjunctus TaxID=1454001 RepID=A0A011M9R7_9PROT|nr:MAG: potassium transport protein Kup [Candidatus Accumulibacter adjunctus]
MMVDWFGRCVLATGRGTDRLAAEAVGGERRSGLAVTAVAAMGVVFGDIGTSPLYTMKEVFGGHHPLPPSAGNVLGILSLVFWALTITVSLKYVLFIMRADNRGEGGIMALTALALRTANATPRMLWLMSALGIFGAALFYGDAVITPAMSVLSAVEGLEVATPLLKPWVLPITVVILVLLFVFQRHGTAAVGALFGPLMMLWFLTLGLLGLWNVIQNPSVLAAINPWYALSFCLGQPGMAFLALGSVVLAITGGEALYADMGHFGRRAIKWAWFVLVFPLLYLNYLGQGALILADPQAIASPFFRLVPDERLVLPLVVLATTATVIASQAVISGAFSLTSQAMQLGYCPRIQVRFTSEREKGQIYVPNINWLLLLTVIVVVLGFRSSSNLASAYGIAVTLTMMIDTLLAFVVVRALWQWSWPRAALFLVFFVVVDFAFFAANVLKIVDGGWFPLAVGTAVFVLLSTWRRGRRLLAERQRQQSIPLADFIAGIAIGGPQRVSGSGVFLTAHPEGVPRALLHNLNHNQVLHERVVVLNVAVADVPHVAEAERVRVEALGQGFHRVHVAYGFKDEPDLPRALALCAADGLAFDMMTTSFFLGRDTVVRLPAGQQARMANWRQTLFNWMFRNADTATEFFKLPPNRVVELGAQVELC